MVFSACVLGLIGTVTAIPGSPKPCNFPSQFETRISRYNTARGEHENILVAFDSQNKRFFEQDVITSRNPGQKFYERIILWEHNVMYLIDMKTRKCNRTAIPKNMAWRPVGVPANASFIQMSEIGSYNEGFSANEFALRGSMNKGETYYARWVVTGHTCVPVSQQILTSTAAGLNPELSLIEEFSDVVLGIANPELFTPPAICFSPPPPPPPPKPTSCHSALESLCGRDKTPSANCVKCCDVHEATLQKDGCKYTDIDAFCYPKQ